jgi:beta-lactamase regulating signal transducer with metallopeptidase domain
MSNISMGQFALVAWALVSLVLIVRIGFSHFSLSRLARSKDAASDAHDREWIPLVNQARVALGIRRQVRVRTTDALGVPAVAGIFQPVLLLPAEAVDWHQETREAVVLHELAHVARWDAAGQLLSQLACALYWCVPLAWHGARRAAVLREQASDDVVLLSGVKASAYAANLLNVARLSGNMSLEPATLAMAHPRRIRERIVAILDPACKRASMRTGSFAGVTLTVLAVALLVATLQPTTMAAPVQLPADVSVEPSEVTSPAAPPNVIDVPRGPAAEAGPSVGTATATAGAATAVALSSPALSALPIASAGITVFSAATGLAAPPPQTASLRGCERDLKETSSTSHSDGKSKYWAVKISGPDCKVDMRVDGEVEFNDTFTDVKSLSRGGAFKLDVTEGGVRHELDMQERSGSLNRVYRVDGRERSFDSDAQNWFAQFLVTLDRRTAVGVDQRLPVLLRQGGVGAVLKETALMPSDYARGRYYEKMMETRQLNDGEKAQVLRQAATMTKSDYYASTLLSQVSKGGYSNNELRTAALAMLDAMDSDYYRSTSVATIVGQGRPTADDMDVLVRTVERIKSDHYKLEVLNRLVGGQLQPQHRAALTRAARSIESDYYASEFLKTLVKSGVDDGNRQVFFDVIGTIESDHYALEALKVVVGSARLTRSEFSSSLRFLSAMKSDHYRTETVKTVLTSSALTEADLLELGAVIAATGGEYYKSEALLAIVNHRAASDRVRSAVINASDRLSSHYREQIRRAAGR